MVEEALALVIGVGGTVFGIGVAGIAIAWLNDRRHDAKGRRLPPPDPRVELELRYVKGEISEEEFDRKMHRLTYGPPIELPHTD